MEKWKDIKYDIKNMKCSGGVKNVVILQCIKWLLT